LAEELAAPHIPADLRLDLTRAIAALPEAYRVALILRDVEELTAPEVAASLGLSVQAVKSRLHRARAMVRESLMSGGYWDRDGESGSDPREVRTIGR
jgi:DNA-directed RNA polymerase specialized sigma24 family protein